MKYTLAFNNSTKKREIRLTYIDNQIFKEHQLVVIITRLPYKNELDKLVLEDYFTEKQKYLNYQSSVSEDSSLIDFVSSQATFIKEHAMSILIGEEWYSGKSSEWR
ncbi:MAG: hypothetical protein H6581_10860 [Bacteroidia bacterium]|nr:hypothetical protein [Bacteroidia bacterium]